MKKCKKYNASDSTILILLYKSQPVFAQPKLMKTGLQGQIGST
jgi:hypothetical protein